MRAVDWNGHCPDDDGPATAAEREGVEWVEDYLRWRAEGSTPGDTPLNLHDD